MSELKPRRRTLNYALLRAVALSMVAAFLIGGLVLLGFGRQVAHNHVERNLSTIGDILTEQLAFPLSLATALGGHYAQEAKEILKAGKHHDDIDKLCLYREDGLLFSSYRSPRSQHACGQYFSQQEEGLRQRSAFSSRIVFPATTNNATVGFLVIETRGEELQASLAAMALAIFGTLFAAVLFAFLMGQRLLTRSLEPLAKLSVTSREIAQNPLAKQRAMKSYDDEIGDLVDTFNHMLDALEVENQKLGNSEKTFRQLAENAPVGIFKRAFANKFAYVNDAWCRITGLDRDLADTFSSYIAPDYRRRYIENVAQLGQSTDYVSIEFEFAQPDGKYRFLHEYVSIVNTTEETYFVGTLVDVTELKNVQFELEKLAFYDPLTKLPNRRFLQDHLQYAFASANKKHKKIAVFMTDLDNFKRVNDSLGHDAGDALLEKVGGRLREAVFREDIVVRMGGDEFLILVEDVENLNSVEFISKRLINAMKCEAEYERTRIPVSGSVGVAMYPDDADTPESLLRYADMALYNSKARGGACFSCYSSELDDAIREQVYLETRLRDALENNLIDVYLQPQFEGQSKTPIWAEALVRWFDKEEGYISPARFIPVAEESGLIHLLGQRVLERVCEMLRDHGTALRAMGIQGVSVNLSARQFYSETLEKMIGDVFRRYAIDPSHIEFELTESTVTDDMDRAITVMETLRDVGCRLSIDDFGTGYSSLSYLKRFPLNSLKIDRTFVDDIPDNKSDCEIACAVINLAHNLGLSVVAEGVETQAQLDFLHQNGCEYFQGFYLARPLSLDQLLIQFSASSEGAHRLSEPD